MCGIIGYRNPKRPVNQACFDKARDLLRHRGPDDAGTWISPDGCTALGHRRLSLVDLSSEGRQPMSNEDGTLWLSFNGEIYNHPELRAELERCGHRFRSHSDTEIILHGYEEWGAALLHRLVGMFAFGLWDERRRRLWLVRDRFGIKPLYYREEAGAWMFASELKGILGLLPQQPPPRVASLSDYLTYRYVPSPYTIWEGIYKLPPAHYLFLSDHQAPQPVEYWKLPGTAAPLREAETLWQMKQLLNRSVREHLQCDVPVGAFLSGGYDSSALVGLMQQAGFRPQTFSIGFQGWAGSEDQYAAVVARHLDLPLKTATLEESHRDLLPQLVYHYDEPIADISIVPTYAVSALARQSNKAVFSGEGADELFGGYTWQREIARYGYWQAKWENGRHQLAGKGNFFVERYAQAMSMGRFGRPQLQELLRPEWRHGAPADSEWFYRRHYRSDLRPLKAFQYLDVKTFMAELVLTKIDRASMAHSLEVRVPFLDHRLFEAIFPLPKKCFFRPEQTKYLLWQLIRSFLPPEILSRPKQGFVGPDSYYMDLPWYQKQLTGGRLIRDGVVQPQALQNLLERQEHWKLWKLTVLEHWWRRWI